MTYTDNIVKKAFIDLENFLQKIAALDIFDTLIFNYKIKLGLLDTLASNFLSIAHEFSRELQVLKETEDSASQTNYVDAVEVCMKETVPVDVICENSPVVLPTSLCKADDKNDYLELEQDNASKKECENDHVEGISTNIELQMDEQTSENVTSANDCEGRDSKGKVKEEEEEEGPSEADDDTEAQTIGDIDIGTCAQAPNTRSRSRIDPSKSKTCPHCFRRFLYTGKMMAHLANCQKARKPPPQWCKHCGISFTSQQLLDSHVAQVHPASSSGPADTPTEAEPGAPDAGEPKVPSDLPFYCCKGCHFAFKTLDVLKAHSCKEKADSADTGIYSPDCTVLCGRRIIVSMQVLQAMRNFWCSICCEEYRSLARMQYHLLRCIKGPYSCELCVMEYPTRIELNKHKKKMHRDANSFFCEECGQAFKLRASLQKHKVTRHEVSQDATCAVCGRSFTKRMQLTNHMIREHGTERRFLCQVCGNKFLTEQSLKTHLTSSHIRPKLFSCSYCGKKFREKEKLKFHIRIHTGERPHLCAECGKCFIRKWKLDEHMRRHRGEKRYECRICDKRYASSWDLKLHNKKFHPCENVTDNLLSNLHRRKTSTAAAEADADDPEPREITSTAAGTDGFILAEVTQTDAEQGDIARLHAPVLAEADPALDTVEATEAGQVLLPQLVVDSSQPHVAVGSSQPHAAVGSSQPHTAVGSSQPHAAVGSSQPHVAVGSSQPHVAVGSSQPHVAVGSSQTHTAVGSSQPHVAVGSSQPAVGEGKQLLLQLNQAQLPMQLLAGDGSGRLMMQLAQASDASSRILVHMEPSTGQVPAAAPSMLPAGTVLAMTDTLQLALAGVTVASSAPAQFLQMAAGMGATGTAAPLHLQLPVSAASASSAAGGFTLQPLQAIFAPTAFNSISY